ncbi:hypothetical protein [Paenibacillus sp. M-152]|uniref:nSTAND3 domain-containing NTPase n=1 Tax=Paenibacillus sp. M-152 TaxID=2487928 RepID=UPI000F70E845|nr:hypothetical protein [Paenibacillus sp. M-152]AZH30627.1 hypothetical protein EGM68_18595 [Paenibacillus sp. M-152]
MFQVDSIIQKVISEIRSSNAIAIIGAGVSFGTGMPLTGQLPPLLWMTYDEHPDLKKELAGLIGVNSTTSKSLIGDDWNHISKAFELITTNNSARKTFQAAFSLLDAERSLRRSYTHEAIARLAHNGIIEKIVSLNWDTLIEKSWKRLYGTDINDHKMVLHKPHGDALIPDQTWILPHEPGYIPIEILEFLQDMCKERPRTLIIIGYSEKDDIVVKNLIAPLQERWRVIRIGPEATGKNDIPLPAEQVLPLLADSLCIETTGWRHLTFSSQRDIASAIAGHRLSPSDVVSCPRLPQVKIASRNLEISNFVDISGMPGCGKSITAYQVAYDYLQSGWEVLLAEGDKESEELLLKSASNLMLKTVLVVDDAQIYSNSFLPRLIALSSTFLKIIITSTKQIYDNPEKILISNSAAVQTLRNSYLERRDEVLPIVRSFDDLIGERYLDIPIERRIEEAGKAESPWHFNFILRGGWQKANDELMVLRDLNGADLLLVSISIKQFLNLDAPMSLEGLDLVVKYYKKDNDWLQSNLDILRKRNLLLSGNHIRTPHIRFASVVINRFFEYASDTEIDLTISFMQQLMLSVETPLQGISWLLNEIRFIDKLRYDKYTVISDSVWNSIIERCWVTDMMERRNAAFVLNALARTRVNGNEKLIEHLPILAQWIEKANDKSAYALANLVNDIYNHSYEAAEKLVSLISPMNLASRLNEARVEGAYSWGHLLGRIRLCANDQWCEQFKTSINQECLKTLITNMSGEDIEGMSKLITEVASYDHEFAFQLLDNGFPIISNALNNRPLDTWRELQDINWRLLGHIPGFLRQEKPNSKQKQYSKKIAQSLPIQKISSDLSQSRQRDWERYAHFLGEWLKEVDKRIYLKIINCLDIEKLNRMTDGLWSSPPRELRLLLITLSANSDHEPAKTLLMKHESEINVADPILVTICPEAIAGLVIRGGNVNLFGHNGHNWGLIAMVIMNLKKISESVYRKVMEDNSIQIISAISKLQSIDCDDLIIFLNTLEKEDFPVLIDLMSNINVDEAEYHWSLRLSEKAPSKRTVAALVSYASMCPDKVGELARKLEKRIPNKFKVRD